MLEVKEDSQKLGEFFVWLQSTEDNGPGLAICHHAEPKHGFYGYRLAQWTTETILARYFGIDLLKAEHEKRKVLEYQRRMNQWNKDNQQ